MRIFKRYILPILLLTSCILASAEDGVNTGYSPYSKFGIGRLGQRNTAYSQTMGGVGVANRNHRYINTLNPAAVAARDTLAFMCDFSILQNNSYYSQNGRSSVDNTFNINTFVMSFPIWRSSAFMVGINPFSGLGYNFSDVVEDPDIVGVTGNVSDYSKGTGSLYELYLGAGATFWKRLSVGAQMNFYFGNLTKTGARSFENASLASIYSVSAMSVWGLNGKFGLQYEQPIGKKDRLTVGATYSLRTQLRGQGSKVSYTTQSSVVDTLGKAQPINLDKTSIPDAFTVGLSYANADRFYVEFDYSRSDWRNSGMDKVEGFASKGFTCALSQSFNLGMEFTPNRNDIRYYMRRVTYRLGAYYSEDYYRFNGNKVSAAAITLGMTLPVFRWSNGLTLGMEVGQRGNAKNGLVRENFVNFSIGINIYDIWFVKPKYE